MTELPAPPPPRALIYQIFVDRFAGRDGGAVPPLPPDVRPWLYHCGGHLAGITARMDHIARAGADALYLTPVFEAATNHKYDTTDFLRVDTQFGGDEAFAALADACRARGTGLILDGVFNHIGSGHPWFRAALATPDCPEHEYFLWARYPDDYDCWRGHKSLPELNLANLEVREYFLGRGPDAPPDAPPGVVVEWLRRGATGWRLDCANDVGVPFCTRIRAAVEEAGGRDGVIGEVMNYPENRLTAASLDGVMNYYFRETVLGLLRGEIPVTQAAYNFKRMTRRFPYPSLLRSWNMLSSHDTPRLKSEIPDQRRRLMAFTLAAVFPGIPHVYYGDEIGMEGGRDPDCRRPMIWDEAQWEMPVFERIRLLARLRREHDVLREGQYVPLPQPGFPQMLSFARVGGHEQEFAIALFNCSNEPFKGLLFLPHSELYDGMKLHDLLGETNPGVMGPGTLRIELPPWTCALLQADDTTIPGYSFFKRHRADA